MGIGFVLVILSAVLFGIMPVLAKQIYTMGGNPLSLCVYRFLFSIPFLWGVVKRSKEDSLLVTKEQMRKVLILSLGCAGTPLLLFQSYQYISSGMATTIHFVYPILVLLGSALIYHEKMTRLKIVCAGLCMAGILCFYSPGQAAGMKGVVLAFCSGIMYAFYILYFSKSGLAELSPYKLSIYLSIFSTLWLLLAALGTGQLITDISWKAWALTIVFSLMVAVFASVFFQIGTSRIGAEKASLLSTFEPLTSVVAGVIFFKEQLTLKSVGGIVCILLAVLLLAAGEKKRA